MAGILIHLRNIADRNRNRRLVRPRVFRDRTHPLDMYDDEEIRRRYRLTRQLIMSLHDIIGPGLEPDTNRNHAVPAILQLFTALRYYATGTFQNVVGDNSGIHRSTVSRIITRVTVAICTLQHRYIKFPRTREDIRQAKEDFYAIASMPNVLGAIDGK